MGRWKHYNLYILKHCIQNVWAEQSVILKTNNGAFRFTFNKTKRRLLLLQDIIFQWHFAFDISFDKDVLLLVPLKIHCNCPQWVWLFCLNLRRCQASSKKCTQFCHLYALTSCSNFKRVRENLTSRSWSRFSLSGWSRSRSSKAGLSFLSTRLQ